MAILHIVLCRYEPLQISRSILVTACKFPNGNMEHDLQKRVHDAHAVVDEGGGQPT